MIRLIKLYSSPTVFTPISFDNGINLLLGEKVDETSSMNRKTNGVGKSMCIEFINFCLLKKSDTSRVMRIPKDVLASDTQIILDLEINKIPLTLIRTTGKPQNPIFIQYDKPNEFSSLEDATNYLSNIIIDAKSDDAPSFRQLINLMIRDERSEFKNIIQTFDTSRSNIPPDYTPHLYLFNIDLINYHKVKNINVQIDQKTKYKSELIKKITQKYPTVKEAFSELNALKDEVGKIGKAVDELQSNAAFDAIQKDLVSIEAEMDTLRAKQKAIRYELKKIQSLPEPEKITDSDIEIIYDQFRQGLGEVIAKSLDQVKMFKAKIDSFQQMLLRTRKQELDLELDSVSERLRILENDYSEKLAVVNTKGRFKNIKTAMAIYTQKSDLLATTRVQLENFETVEKELKQSKLDRSNLIALVDNSISEIKSLVENFEKTILDIHQDIMGTEKASFRIETIDKTKRKEVLNFQMQIDYGGSHSVDRIQTFIYDMALLFNSYTRQRHPRMLIHDNIFDVDKDTLIQSLNFLNRMETLFPDFQYILTLNKDEIEHFEDKIELNIETHLRAEFTRKKPFLLATAGLPYQEQNSNK